MVMSLGQAEDQPAFDVREATISGVRNAVLSGRTTARNVTEAFLARIEAFNELTNAIITLNPDALADAGLSPPRFIKMITFDN